MNIISLERDYKFKETVNTYVCLNVKSEEA